MNIEAPTPNVNGRAKSPTPGGTLPTTKTILTIGSMDDSMLGSTGKLLGEDGTVKKTSVAEWLFSDENGQMAGDVNLHEMEELYNGYIQQMVSSYDKIKTKFNTYAAKCLSEKQKRECGLSLVAPPIVMPHEVQQQNLMHPNQSRVQMSPRSKKLAMLQQKNFDEEEKDGDSRMGGRMGHQIKKTDA